MSNKRLINTRPSKSFFIKTLVRDIQLIDAVLDLVDNSIDSYIKKNFHEKKSIKINFNRDRFVIEDDCGGIQKDQVYEHVFKFGEPTREHAKTIGVYGIGLKRAIFKMGQNILIESDDGIDYFSVRIDNVWLEKEDAWDLNF